MFAFVAAGLVLAVQPQGLRFAPAPLQATKEVRLAEARSALQTALESSTSVPIASAGGRSGRTLLDGATIEMSFNRSAALLRIAHGQAIALDLAGALRTLADYQKLAKGNRSAEFDGQSVSIVVARQLARSGDLERALAIAGKDRDAVNAIYLDIVTEAVLAKDIVKAMELLGKIGKGWERTAAQSRITIGLAMQGDYLGSMQQGAKIEDVEERIRALIEAGARTRVAGAKDASSQFRSECLRLVPQITDRDTSFTQMVLAVELARSQDYVGAEKLAEHMSDLESGVVRSGNVKVAYSGEYGLGQRVKCQIALEQARAGRFEEAIQGASRAKDVPSKEIRSGNFIIATKGLYGVKGRLLCQVSIEQSRANEVAGAAASISQALPIPEGGTEELALAYAELGAAQARLKQMEQASATFSKGVKAALATARSARSIGLRKNIVEMSNAGLADLVRTSLIEGEETLKAEKYTYYDEWENLVDIAMATQNREFGYAVMKGMFDKAKEVPPVDWMQEEGGGQLIGTANLLSRFREYDMALKLAERTQKPEFRAAIYCTVAMAQGRDGDIKGARAWIDKLSQPLERTFALITFGEALVDDYLPVNRWNSPIWDFEWMPT